MFKSLLTAGTAVALSVGAASAADLPRRAARAAAAVFTPVPVFTWTGPISASMPATPTPRPTA